MKESRRAQAPEVESKFWPQIPPKPPRILSKARLRKGSRVWKSKTSDRNALGSDETKFDRAVLDMTGFIGARMT